MPPWPAYLRSPRPASPSAPASSDYKPQQQFRLGTQAEEASEEFASRGPWAERLSTSLAWGTAGRSRPRLSDGPAFNQENFLPTEKQGAPEEQKGGARASERTRYLREAQGQGFPLPSPWWEHIGTSPDRRGLL